MAAATTQAAAARKRDVSAPDLATGGWGKVFRQIDNTTVAPTAVEKTVSRRTLGSRPIRSWSSPRQGEASAEATTKTSIGTTTDRATAHP